MNRGGDGREGMEGWEATGGRRASSQCRLVEGWKPLDGGSQHSGVVV